MMPAQPSTFGPLLRRWRASRRLTQEQLADDAEVSTRHLSCLESGKAQPSREMVLVLASALELELRDRNVLLGAAGFAPVYRASPLQAAAMAPLRSAIELLLRQQEPYGAIVVDRTWNVLQWNDGARRLFARFMPRMPTDPRVATNVVHGLFSPEGLRPCIVNWEQVAAFTIERMHREIARHPEDPEGLGLRDAILAYPGLPERFHVTDVTASVDPFLAVHLRRGADEVRLFSTLTTLGTPLDVTAQELILESYFPADEASDRYLRALAESRD
jgi:transcriptional regulator with XRE-family HTH domain